jgi:hypothetical protein
MAIAPGPGLIVFFAQVETCNEGLYRPITNKVVSRRSIRQAGSAVAFAAAVLSLALGGCRIKGQEKSAPVPAAGAPKLADRRGPETEQIGWLTVRLENRPPASLMEVKPENLPAHLKSLYRLRPDRRFLYAAAELQRLATGGPRSGTLALRFEENRWRLALDGAPLGDLPELPSLADARDFLVSRARARPASKGA